MEEITIEDIKKEFPELSSEQHELILYWIDNARNEGYDDGSYWATKN